MRVALVLVAAAGGIITAVHSRADQPPATAVRPAPAPPLWAGISASHVVVPEDPAGSDVDGMEPWALLRGLIEDFEVALGPSGTALTMTWPLR